MMEQTKENTPGKRRIAVSSTGESLDSPLDPRFGRCSHFIVVDGDKGHRVVKNTGHTLGNGAGIQAAQQVLDMGVEVVLTGDLGPNAFRVLSTGNVRAYVGCRGTVNSVLEDYANGKLREALSPTAPGHHGHGHGHGARGS